MCIDLYGFLAEKMIRTHNSYGVENVLRFWVDTIIQTYEDKSELAVFCAQDKEIIKKDVEEWFYSVLHPLLRVYVLFNEYDTAKRKIRNAVYSRARFAIVDYLRARGGARKGKNKKEKEKEKEKERKKEPTCSSIASRSISISSTSQDNQDKIFSSAENDLELSYIKKELMDRFDVNSLDDLALMLKENKSQELKEFVRQYLNILGNSKELLLDDYRRMYKNEPQNT